MLHAWWAMKVTKPAIAKTRHIWGSTGEKLLFDWTRWMLRDVKTRTHTMNKAQVDRSESAFRKPPTAFVLKQESEAPYSRKTVMADHRKQLTRPDAVDKDEYAVEMIRGWIAERGLSCSLNLGHWHHNSKLDERHAWGVLIADLVREIAIQLEDVTKQDPSESLKMIVEAMLSELGNDGSSTAEQESLQDPS